MHPVDDPPAKRRRVVDSIIIASVVIGLDKHSPAFFFHGREWLGGGKRLSGDNTCGMRVRSTGTTVREKVSKVGSTRGVACSKRQISILFGMAN
jgi:hypothetical protein